MTFSDIVCKRADEDLLELLNNCSGPEAVIDREIFILFKPVRLQDTQALAPGIKESFKKIAGTKLNCKVDTISGVATFQSPTAGQVIDALELDFVTKGKIVPRVQRVPTPAGWER